MYKFLIVLFGFFIGVILRLRFKEFNYFSGEAMGFSNGQRTIRKALERQGVDIVYESDVELQHVSPHIYHKNCKKSFIMPTHEANAIHPLLIKKMNESDEVIALCEHNKKVFTDNGLKKPIHVCKQGIDLNIFKYNEKVRNGKLNFLWIGQTSIRKGWDIVINTFTKAFGSMKDVSLYMKTSGAGKQEINKLTDNIIFDSRRLSLADMIDLYTNAHIFIFPSRGEATGLPALEAMASGLICMAPAIGGMKEFIDEDNAIKLEYKNVPADYGVKTVCPNVIAEDLIEKLRYVYDFYDEIKSNTKAVRGFIERNYCVNLMAKKLIRILFGG